MLRAAGIKQPFTKSWLHVDENLRQTRVAGASIQCAVNFIAGTPSRNGAFVCVPGSHHTYRYLAASTLGPTGSSGDDRGKGEGGGGAGRGDGDEPHATAAMATTTTTVAEKMRQFMRPERHFLPLPDLEHPLLAPHLTADRGAVRCIALSVEAGDMVAWRSTLVHANVPPTDSKKKAALSPPAPRGSTQPKKQRVSRQGGGDGGGGDGCGEGGEGKAEVKNSDGDQGGGGTESTGSGDGGHGLRRVAAFVSFYPKRLLAAHVASPDEWTRRRRAACEQAFTAGHDPVDPGENNRMSRYGRHRSFAPVLTPADCRKREFSADELALL